MKEYGFTINLQDDPHKIQAYKEYHRHVWPQVLACLREVGISRMHIYLLDRRLFMCMETIDSFEPKRDFRRLEEMSERYREWQALTNTFQKRAPEARPGEHWAEMEQVFTL